MSDLKQYWVGLNMIKVIGAVRFRSLLNAFGDAESIWQASPAALRASDLSQKIVDNLVMIRSSVSLDQI